MCSRIDTQTTPLTHPNPNSNRNFDRLTSGLMHAEGLPASVSIAKDVLFLQHGQTYTQTDKQIHTRNRTLYHATATAGVGSNARNLSCS